MPALAAQPGRPEPDARCVLLVTVDTLRWDAIGLAKQRKVRTPVIDRLGREGVYLPQAHAAAPLTAPSHATLLTGLLPVHHGVRDNARFRLAPGARTLAESYGAAGYRTAAFVAAEPLRREIGLSRGFDLYDDSGFGKSNVESIEPASRDAAQVTEAALAWMDGAGRGGGDLFLWVHYYDPHYPYTAPEARGRPAASGGYEREIEFVDHHLGRLMARLAADYPDGRLRVVLTSDHGEGLGDHGEATHGNGLYDTTLSVPLIFWPDPGIPTRQRRHPALVDVAPTLRAWSGLGQVAGDGMDLVAGVESAPPRWLLSESVSPTLGFGVSPAYALRRGDDVAILSKRVEVFNSRQDPAQKNDLGAGTGRNFGLVAAQELQRLVATRPALLNFVPEVAADPERLRRLAALGYSSGRQQVTDWRRHDRREFILAFEKMQRARGAFFKKEYAAAIAGYRAFLKLYPKAAQPWQELGLSLLRSGDAVTARDALERADALDPDNPVTLMNLGGLAGLRGDAAVARDYFNRSLAVDPKQAEASFNLAALELKAGAPCAALPHINRFIRLAPTDPETPKLRDLVKRLEPQCPAASAPAAP